MGPFSGTCCWMGLQNWCVTWRWAKRCTHSLGLQTCVQGPNQVPEFPEMEQGAYQCLEALPWDHWEAQGMHTPEASQPDLYMQIQGLLQAQTPVAWVW